MTPPRLKTNLAILVAGDVANKLINLVMFGHLARKLEPAGFGRLSFVLATAFVGALMIEGGLNPWGARAVARGEEPQGRILGRILALRAMILAGVLLLLFGFAAVLGSHDPRAGLLLAASLMLVAKAALCDWLFQGRNEMGSVTLTQLLDPLISLACVFALVREPEHVVRVPLIFAASIGVVALVQQALARRRGIRADLVHGLDAAGRMLSESLPLGLSTLAWGIRYFAPVIAVALAGADSMTGEFGAAHQLIVSLHATVVLWFFNLLPSWSKLHKNGAGLEHAVNRSFLLTLALAAAMVLGVFVVAPFVIQLIYGAGYASDSPMILRILAIAPALSLLSGNFRFGLIAKGALRAELAAGAAGAGFAVTAFLVLGSRVDVQSAAVVLCGAEAITLIVAWWMWRRRIPDASGGPTPTAEAPRAARLP